MVYGITNRAGWFLPEWDNYAPPTGIWAFWDEYKIWEKIMVGFWDKNCPVGCNDPMIRASVFKDDDETLISVANWSDRDKDVSLIVDWEKLGKDPFEAEVFIPEIKDFQAQQTLKSLDKITVPGNKGFVIVVK